MDEPGFITIVGAEDSAYTRSDEVTRVTRKISVAELNRNFSEFLASLEAAFAVGELTTRIGAFALSEITFSAELTASGDFKLLGTGVGVAAGSALSFTFRGQDAGGD